MPALASQIHLLAEASKNSLDQVNLTQQPNDCVPLISNSTRLYNTHQENQTYPRFCAIVCVYYPLSLSIDNLQGKKEPIMGPLLADFLAGADANAELL
jgi:hypothetical protein